MKTKCLIVIFSLISGLLSAQSFSVRNSSENRLHSTGIACIYDFSKSMTETIYDSQSDTTVRYYYATSDTSSFSLTEAKSADELLSSLCAWNDLLIFVHGYGEGLTKRIFRDQLLTSLYNMDVIVFYWPSDMKEKGIKSFSNTKENMEKTFPLFESFLGDVLGYVKKNQIHCTLMFSSLGNRYAMMLGEKYASNLPSVNLSFVDNIVLNQACVPFAGYEEWAVPLSKQIGGKLYITSNRKDAVLALAHRTVESRRLLGQGSDKENSYLPLPNIEYVDFTELVKGWGTKYSHNFYIHNPKKADPSEVIKKYVELFE